MASPHDDHDHDHDDDHDEREPRRLADPYRDVRLPPLPLGPGGVPLVQPAPAPLPPATPETMICLRGPCRHYWQLESWLDVGNPVGTFGGETGLRDPLTGALVPLPRQIHRTCLCSPSGETDLTDTTVLACSRWEPMLRAELLSLAGRRASYETENKKDSP